LIAFLSDVAKTRELDDADQRHQTIRYLLFGRWMCSNRRLCNDDVHCRTLFPAKGPNSAAFDHMLAVDYIGKNLEIAVLKPGRDAELDKRHSEVCSKGHVRAGYHAVDSFF
jgi:hypothetical protein